MSQVTSSPTRVLLERQVLDRIGGCHRATMWRWIERGLFPRPIKIGSNRNAWLESEIEAYMQARIEHRNSPATHEALKGHQLTAARHAKATAHP